MRRTELDPSAGPGAAFGVQLRRSREAMGFSQVGFGKVIGYSDTFISCVERATRNPSYDFAVKSDGALLTGGTLELMWWSIGHTSLLEGLPEYVAREAKAMELRMFDLGVIPGLFQTKAYAEALAAADVKRGSITDEQAHERVTYLLARQKRLERKNGPLVHAVLDESCLRRFVGGASIMRGQLERLEELADDPEKIIQVAPLLHGRAPTVRPPRVLGHAAGSNDGRLHGIPGTRLSEAGRRDGPSLGQGLRSTSGRIPV
jgi:transcriptional regulator with XRE-family HTH domain